MRRLRTARALERQVGAFVAGLGSTGSEIAARLSSEGVSGVPGATDDCALAVYLHAVLGPDCQVQSVKVTNDAVAVYWSRRRGIAVPLPEPVREFIGEFDAGRFPALVRVGGERVAGAAGEAVPAPSGSIALGEVSEKPSPSAGEVCSAGPQATDAPESGAGAADPAQEGPFD